MTLKSPISSVEWYFLHEFAIKSTLDDFFRNEYRKLYLHTTPVLYLARSSVGHLILLNPVKFILTQRMGGVLTAIYFEGNLEFLSTFKIHT